MNFALVGVHSDSLETQIMSFNYMF